MAKNPDALIQDLTRGFRWILVMCALFAVCVVFMKWNSEVRLRNQTHDEVETPVISPEEMPLVATHWQTVYIPAYSHVYRQDGRPLLLTVTLGVRNTDSDHEIAIVSVQYVDSRGKVVKSYLDRPVRLKPLSALEFLVERSDTSGGSSASFIVEWVSEEEVVEPIIETVMIDTERGQGISFARRGIVVARSQDDDVEQR